MKLFLSLAALAFLSICAPNLAQAEQPLLQEGKKSVFLRVVSHPGAEILSAPNGSSVKKPRTFTAFYVYEKQNGHLRVGVSSTKADGWIKESECTDWPQAITMVFTDQMGRQPVLFFKEHKNLDDLCKSDNISGQVEKYLSYFRDGASTPDNCPVMATEPLPEKGQIAQDDFYLLPVLRMDRQYQESGTRLIEVACIDAGIGASGNEDEALSSLRKNDAPTTGIVFVIDTTISMKPYIDQTRTIVRNIYNRLQSSIAKEHIALAVVAFRSNVKKSPKTEYTTKIISDFAKVENREQLEGLLSQVEECKAPTHDFNEDSLAGVKEAVDNLSWDMVTSKSIILITDAGPLEASDPTSRTGMSSEGMADYLKTNKIFLTAVHIKTPAGEKNHAYAEKSYKELSKLSNDRPSYAAIDASTPRKGAESFRRVGHAMADTYCKLAEKVCRGEALEKPDAKDLPENASPEEIGRRIAEATGYAMQLQFAGDKQRTRAPEVKHAWIADTDLSALDRNPGNAPLPVVKPAVLLTKLQLSQLRKQLKDIIATAEEAFLRSSSNFNFYEQLISAAAQMSSDPSKFSQDPSQNLAQKGILLEVLDGLPYKSRVLGLQKEDWENMSTGEREKFIKRLKGLIRRYEEYDRDNSHWESFGSKNSNEWVYRVPLDVLP